MIVAVPNAIVLDPRDRRCLSIPVVNLHRNVHTRVGAETAMQ